VAKTLLVKGWYHHSMLMKTQSNMNPSDADEGTPVSVKIRERLAAARKRFYANDNIAEFIQPGELERSKRK
jgi:GTP cyclohydrolase IA